MLAAAFWACLSRSDWNGPNSRTPAPLISRVRAVPIATRKASPKGRSKHRGRCLGFFRGGEFCAEGAEVCALQIDPLNAVRGAHHACVVGAMTQAVGVAQFVEGFL